MVLLSFIDVVYVFDVLTVAVSLCVVCVACLSVVPFVVMVCCWWLLTFCWYGCRSLLASLFICMLLPRYCDWCLLLLLLQFVVVAVVCCMCAWLVGCLLAGLSVFVCV